MNTLIVSTPLQIAIALERIEIVRLLLNADGIIVNGRAVNGFSALMKASIGGNIEIMRIILESKVPINLEERGVIGRTSLVLAAKENHTAIVYLLLKHGANINSTDAYGITTLMFAAINNNVKMVKLLLGNIQKPNLEHKPDRTFLITATNSSDFVEFRKEMTALRYAKYNGFREIEKLLLDAGSDKNFF